MRVVGGIASGTTPIGVRASTSPRRCRPRSWRRSLIGATAVVCSLACHRIDPAHAAPPTIQIPTEEQLQPGEEASPLTGPFAFMNGISRSNYMLGDMWGLRTELSKYGISFALQETSEVLGNPTGGIQARRRL
jgi:porin